MYTEMKAAWKRNDRELNTVASVVVLGHQVRHLSLLFFGEKTVSLGPGVVQDQIESLCVSGDFEPLLVAGFGRGYKLDHGMGRLRLSCHDECS